MLRIDHDAKSLKPLTQKSAADAGLRERQDIQKMVRNSPEPFFAEMGEELLLVGEEVRPAEFVEDRIDLLAVDNQGAAVVIELKRGRDRLQLLQALKYAGMVSDWDAAQIIAGRAGLTGATTEEAEEEVEQFLLEDVAELNESQRIVLIADDYDYEVLVTAKWLTENYEVDIRCYRLSLSQDEDADYLSCTCIYPPPEITAHAARRGRRAARTSARWPDWDTALEACDNAAIVQFFQQELPHARDTYLADRAIIHNIEGKRRLWVHARGHRLRCLAVAVRQD
jgi:hypothetical protein